MKALRFIPVVAMAAMLSVTFAAPAGAEGFGGPPFPVGPFHFPGGHGRPSGPTTCTGTVASPGVLTGTYRSNVLVTGTCFVDGGAALVIGNLTIAPGADVVAAFASNDVTGTGSSSLTVTGNLLVGEGASLVMGCEPNYFTCFDDPTGTLSSHGSVGGSLIEAQALGVVVHASSIGGYVAEVGGGGGIGADSCVPPTATASSTQSVDAWAAFESPVYSDYEDNSVGGSLDITGLQTCWMGSLRDVVRGNVLDAGNTFADPDANEVNTNTVYGNMACFDNSPQVQFGDSGGSPNQVAGLALGECGFGVELPNPAPAGPLMPISVKI